jgi:hypothetical protein
LYAGYENGIRGKRVLAGIRIEAIRSERNRSLCAALVYIPALKQQRSGKYALEIFAFGRFLNDYSTLKSTKWYK